MQSPLSPDKIPSINASSQVEDVSRRAWLQRGAVVASPVVASLVSAPVHAAGTCVLPSGFISATTFASRHPGAAVCVSEGPNYWHNNVNTNGVWPSGTKSANFTTVFGVPQDVEPGITNGTKLDDVLVGSYSLLAKYCIAAFLNARKGTLGFPLDATQAVAIYKSYHGGTFSPLLVTGWTEAQTVAWLRVLMT